MRSLRSSPVFLSVLAVGDLIAQANVVPGRDIQLQDTTTISRYRRTGTYPSGVQAIGTRTICCNPGVGAIPFQAAMNPNHGFIHYIVASEVGGRLVQISNYAWVKHTFGSNNDPSPCGTCVNQATSSFVEPGCNDTYVASQAVDHFNLGPPGEVDPWLGTWNPVCSHFDRGNPPVAPAQQCDGVRSLTSTQATALNTQIGDAMRVYDDDLVKPGATFWYQSGYLVPGEAEALRGNNIGTRQFTPTWSAATSQWTLTDGTAFQQGTVLQRWTGATINSAANGPDDGRYYVAVKVTGPVNGLYHYEYAVHNRDNKRGMGAFRVPVCAQAQVVNFGFHDFDRNAITDWTAAKVGNEVVFQTNGVNPSPLRWNSIFNFWFDSDAAPQTGSVLLDQYDVGAGLLTLNVSSTTPSGLWNQNLGAGCGIPSAPSLYATGSPDRALIGNATLALRTTGNPVSVPCMFVLSSVPGTTVLGPGCTLYSGDPFTVLGPLLAVSNTSGAASIPLGVPANPSLEGLALDFQMINFAATGALLGNFNLSNGLRVRIGNLIAGCP
ncbi:MAG: hypothetical protein WBO45_16755 [Planctomycetota bacterium]